MPSFEWYDLVIGSELEQGDILENVDIYVPLPELDRQQDIVPTVVETHDMIVLTQSCDIPKDVCKNIVACPIWTLEEAKQAVPHFRTKNGLEDLRTGRVVGFHILNRYEKMDFRRDFRIVSFYRVFELSKNRAIAVADAQPRRLRLLPPYREHLSQAFARFFMRVGLPADIPSFT